MRASVSTRELLRLREAVVERIRCLERRLERERSREIRLRRRLVKHVDTVAATMASCDVDATLLDPKANAVRRREREGTRHRPEVVEVVHAAHGHLRALNAPMGCLPRIVCHLRRGNRRHDLARGDLLLKKRLLLLLQGLDLALKGNLHISLITLPN